jgi:casein kinase II subunit beta
MTWISWFCSLPGHEYFCEVSEEFIEDDFNLTGLNSMVPFWKEAMEMVLDVEPGMKLSYSFCHVCSEFCL